METGYMNYPKFTPEMKKTHKILIPNMAPVQFRILAAAMEHGGYTCELLENCGSQVSELGLKYVHNDTCYPALLVIGQFLDALNSGKIRAAGLDVFVDEPSWNHDLYSHPHVSCTPHIGASTVEGQKRVGQEIVDIISSFTS